MYVAGRDLGVIKPAIFGIGALKNVSTEGEAAPGAFRACLVLLRTGLQRLYGRLVIHLTHGPDWVVATPVARAG
jgi:hypothetical protein